MFWEALMRLVIVFRAFAVAQFFVVVATLAAPELVMESFELTYSADILLVIQLSALCQIMFAIVTFALPSWLGHNLWKAASTYVWISLLPVLLNIYHVASNHRAFTNVSYFENGLWLLFALLFYVFGKKMKLYF